MIDVSFGKEMEKAFNLYTSDTTYIFTRNFNDYYELGYDGKNGKHHRSYIELVDDLLNNFNFANTNFIELPDTAKIDFINTFNQFAKLRHFLKQFGEFSEEKELINEYQYSQYVSHCQVVRLELWKDVDKKNENIYDISNDLTYHSEIYSTEIYDVNKIVNNINDIVQNKELTEDKICEFKIRISATNEPHNKKKLLLAFLERASGNITDGDIISSIENYVLQKLSQDIDRLIRSIMML